MNFTDLIKSITDQNLINFFFKTFAIVFSFLYLLYAIVILKQTQVMTKTVEDDGNNLIMLVSLIQIGIGVVLIFFSLIIL